MTRTADTEPGSGDRVTRQAATLPYLRLARATLVGCKDDQVFTIAAAVAYHTVFAIPPAIVFLVTLAALIEHVTSIPVSERLLHAIETGAPGGSREVLTNLVDQSIANMSGGTAWIGVTTSAIIALWSGSNGVSTAIGACNRAYAVAEDRPLITQKLIAIALTLLMALLSVLAFLLFVFGHVLGSWIATWAGLGGAFETTWNILRWPAAVALIIALLAVMYHLAPNIAQSFRWLSPGAIVATLLWVAIVLGFKLYLAVSNPGSAYGAIGSIGLLLFFLYVSAVAFLIGAEVNAVRMPTRNRWPTLSQYLEALLRCETPRNWVNSTRDRCIDDGRSLVW